MLSSLFIGGTGRSGTSVLFKWLKESKDINGYNEFVGLEEESKFLVCRNGLFDLFDSLTVSYSPEHALFVCKAFFDLMENGFTGKSPGFTKYKFDQWFGEDFYYSHIKDLKEKIYKSNEPKYFKRSELNNILGEFVNTLFSQLKTSPQQKWIEKTPHNILFADKLLDLTLNSKLIHITRDPRAVCESLRRMLWAPNSIDQVAIWVKNVLAKWGDLKEKELKGKEERYLEIRLEDFLSNFEKTINTISAFCLDNRINMDKKQVSTESINSWKKRLKNDEYLYLTEYLKDIILEYGYEL